MSANNEIIIDRTFFEVFYNSGGDEWELIGKGEDLEEAADIAEKYIFEELEGMCEYGIRFVHRVRIKRSSLKEVKNNVGRKRNTA